MSVLSYLSSWMKPATYAKRRSPKVGRRPLVEQLETREVLSTLASVGLTQGWATFGEAFPQGQARGSLQVGNLPTQTDVKTTWADGSIKFAVLTANVPSAGTYPISAVEPSTGSFTPTLPGAEVVLNVNSGTTTTAYTAALPQTPANDRWLSGSQVVEGRYQLAPVAADGSAHPFLRVFFDVRSYNGGGSRLDVSVENTLDVQAAKNVNYSVDIFANGENVYHHNALTHYYLTRWRKTFDVGMTSSVVTPDFSTFQQAQALPAYMSALVPNVVNSTSGASFDIMGGGDLETKMGTVGGRAEIAPYPDWVATYVAHANPTQKKFVTAHGDLAGSWPVHLRQSNGSFVSIDQRPNFVFTNDSRAVSQGWEIPAGNMSNLGPLVPENAHTPSLAYVPYLLTGDRYYADEMGFWGAWGLAEAWPQYRDHSQGLIYPGSGQQRSLAWQLRNITDAAAYLPDTSPAKAYFASKVQSNLTWLDNYADAKTRPLNASFDEPGYAGLNPQNAPWQDGYLSWSVGHAHDQGFQGGQKGRDMLSKFVLQLFNSAPDYPIEYAYAYWLQTGKANANGTVTDFTTMKQVFDANFPAGSTPPESTWYSSQLRFSLHDALKRGFAGAEAAVNYNEVVGAKWLAGAPGWAIALQSAPTITVSAGGTYNGNPISASAVATGANNAAVSGSFSYTYYAGSSATGTSSSQAPTAAGTYTVVANFTSTNPLYLNAKSSPFTFSIAPALPTVSTTAGGGTYSGSSFPASATARTAGGANVSGSIVYAYFAGASATGTGSSQAPTAAGTYTVVATFTSTDANYSSRQGSPVTFTIAKATPLVTAIHAGGAVSGAPVPAFAAVSGVIAQAMSGTISFTYYEGSSAAGTGSSAAPSAAGTYTVVASFTSTDANYSNAVSSPVTFTLSAGLNVAFWDFRWLAASQIPLLTPAQVATIPDTSWFETMSPTLRAALTAPQVQALNTATISIAYLTPTQRGMLTAAQVQKLPFWEYQYLTPATIQLLSPAQIARIPDGSWFATIPAAARQNLTATQIQALNVMAIDLAYLSPAQCAMLSTAQVQQLRFWEFQYLNATVIPLLTPAQVASIPDTSWFATLSVSARAALTAVQVQQLPFWQFQYLTTAQVPMLSPAQIATIPNAPWFATLSPAAQAVLTTVQVQALNATAIGLANLTTAQRAVLSAAQVQQLPFWEFRHLDPSRIPMLSCSQIHSIPDPGWFATLSAEARAALTTAQVQALRVADLGLAYLTPSQRAQLSTAQVQQLPFWEFRYLPPELVSKLTLTQIYWIPNLDWFYTMSPAARAALSPLQLAALRFMVP